MKRHKTVAEFLDALETHKTELTVLRDILSETRLIETVKWGMPTYTHNGKNLVGLSSFKSYFGVWFFQGALLVDSHKKLVNAQEGKTKAMRQWRMKSISDIDAELIKKYVEEAISIQESGHEIKPQRSKPLVIPEELLSALESNNQLKIEFEKLPPYKQKDYAEYILSAKREATKSSRLLKSISMILEGKGLNDKYTNK